MRTRRAGSAPPRPSGARRLLAWAAAALLVGACGGGSAPVKPPEPPPEPVAAEPAGPDHDLEIPQVTYTWDPQAGDPSVPAELGGPGFTGEGWTTRLTFDAMGDPNAPIGGELVRHIEDWPATLRMAGKDWNVSFNYMVNVASYMSLLDLDNELNFIPNVATHWQISDDKLTYRFRINPEATWSDGKPIVADDLVATWQLRVDPTILEPSSNVTWGKFERPKAVSKYIVEVKVKPEDENWKNFLYFATAQFYPAHEIGGMKGSDYLDKYQFAYTAVSGFYQVKPEDIDTGKSITLTRREDFWGRNNPAFKGQGNIGRIKCVVVKDPTLAYEKAKKGELDYLIVVKAQWWAEEIPQLDAVKRGLLVPRKFFNDYPIGTNGYAINQTRPPLDDVRVRKALQLLHDRQTLIKKIYFDEYLPLTSYYQGPYANPDNQLFTYDEFGAVELLKEAGWTELNGEGYRVKDGKVLELSVQYRSPLSERGLTTFQEACKRAGIKLELQLLTPAAGWKNLRERKFDLAETSWGALVFPNPEHNWHSQFATQVDNNNVTAFADPRVDALIDQYDREYDQKKRLAIIREMDAIIYAQHPYVLSHYGPARRVMYWNKFGMPEWGVKRFVDADEMTLIWWVDPEKEKALTAARADAAATLERPPVEHRFWQAWNAARATE